MTAQTNLSHPDVTVLREGGQAKPRVLYRVLGPEHMWGVHNNDLATLRRGVMTRIMYVKGQGGGWVPPPQPVAGVFRRFSRLVRALSREVGGVVPMEVGVLPQHYRGRKRTIYDEAERSLAGLPLHQRDAILSSFIKLEKINFQEKPDPDPRIINPRRPRYNVAVGRYLKPLEERVYSAIDSLFHRAGCTNRTVAKRRNFEQRAWMLHCKWQVFVDPVAAPVDCSRFDQHVRVDALRMEHRVYNYIFACADLKRWLSWQLRNTGLGRARDGLLRWVIDGIRASGDMNTAMGNVILVCIPLLHLKDTLDFHFEVADDGDDCILICERQNMPRLQAAVRQLFTDMGHEVKIDRPVEVFEKIKFCQTQPVFDGHRWTMVRDPHTAIAKDLSTTHDLRDLKTYRWYMGTVGVAGQHLAGGIPVWDAFYRRLERLGGGTGDLWTQDPSMESGFMINARKMNRVGRPVTDTARISFWRAFDIQPFQQILLEQHFGTAFEHGRTMMAPVVQPGLVI